MRRPPSRYRILRTDYRAQGITIFVSMWLLMTLTVGLGFGWKNPVLTLIFAAITALIVLGGGSYVLVRTSRIQRLYAHGHVLPGRVLELGSNSENVEHVIVGYDVGGVSYSTRLVLGVAKYGVGDDVEVLVDPARPKNATVRVLR